MRFEVPPGEYPGLVLEAPGYAPAFPALARIGADDPPEADIALRRGAIVRGRVLDEHGDPMPEVLVYAEFKPEDPRPGRAS